jgi:hypothetical protein
MSRDYRDPFMWLRLAILLGYAVVVWALAAAVVVFLLHVYGKFGG